MVRSYPTMDTFRRQTAHEVAEVDTAHLRQIVKEARYRLTTVLADYDKAYRQSYDRVYDALKDKDDSTQ
jgi:hypothetical protein